MEARIRPPFFPVRNADRTAGIELRSRVFFCFVFVCFFSRGRERRRCLLAFFLRKEGASSRGALRSEAFGIWGGFPGPVSAFFFFDGGSCMVLEVLGSKSWAEDLTR